MKKSMLALPMLAIAAGAVAPAAHAQSIAASTCNVAVARTWAGVTYNAPAYKDAKGHYNACTIAYGTMNSATVTAMQKGLNTFHAPGHTKITTFGNYLTQTKADLKAYQKAMGLYPSGSFDAATSSQMLSPLGILG